MEGEVERNFLSLSLFSQVKQIMDAQARKKALFRAKLNAQKKEKRIDSPLVRYNEFDQPVCRVCDVVLKSEASWDAHQVSRKHHEAINNIKANAAGRTQINNTKPESHPESAMNSQKMKVEPSTRLPAPKTSSGLPSNFFDNHDTAKQKTGASAQSQAKTLNLENKLDGLPCGKVSQTKSNQPEREAGQTSADIAGSGTKQVKGVLPEGFFDSNQANLSVDSDKSTEEHVNQYVQHTSSETTQVKGSIPEGFFDNKEADLRARGIKPVKPDVKDEYKEFEKLIQEDLQEVDNRMEEEEFDAAEMIEEEELVEQKSYKEKVEILKRKKMELEAARSAKRNKGVEVARKEPMEEESSSDDDSDEDFAVDWRAQHL